METSLILALSAMTLALVGLVILGIHGWRENRNWRKPPKQKEGTDHAES